MSYERQLAANLLVSLYSDVLNEPLPERLRMLVQELERRERPGSM